MSSENESESTPKSWLRPVSRRQFLTHSLGWMAIAGTSAAWAYEEPKHVKLEYHQIATDKLKSPIKIVHISDLHLDDDRSRDYVPKMVSNCNADMILMTGDYTNSERRSDIIPGRVEEYMNRMHSKHGTYAVFGNWDIGLEEILFKNTDVKTLKNSVEQIEIGNNKVQLAGVDHVNEYNATRLMPESDGNAYSIMMNHTPDMIDDVAMTGTTDLYLCGHTHGGQIRIPLLRLLQDGKGEFPYSGGIIPKHIAKDGAKYQSGMYDVNGMLAYVSRGIGMSDFPGMPKVRLFCRPEVTLFDIGPKEMLPDRNILPWYQS